MSPWERAGVVLVTMIVMFLIVLLGSFCYNCCVRETYHYLLPAPAPVPVRRPS